MKYRYREHCEVEKALYVFRMLECSGNIPIVRPKLTQNSCFYGSVVEFNDLIEPGLLEKINSVPGVSLLSISN